MYVPAAQFDNPVRTAFPLPFTVSTHGPGCEDPPVKETVPVPAETWAVQDVVDPNTIVLGEQVTVTVGFA